MGAKYQYTILPDGSQLITSEDEYVQGDVLEFSREAARFDGLRVDEQATYIDVYCDGYFSRVRTDQSLAYIITNFDSTPSQVDRYAMFFYISSTVYYMGYAIDNVTIIENTPNRVALKIDAGFSSTVSDGNPLQDSGINDVTAEMYLYFYPDKIAYSIQIFVSSGNTLTIDNSFYNGIMHIDGSPCTNESNINESSGSEQSGETSSYKNSADYVGFTSDETNVIGIVTEQNNSGTATFFQYLHTAGRPYIGWLNGTIGDGDNYIRGMIIVDSVEREGSAKLYDSTDRLAMGDQYKDSILDSDLSNGFPITDMILPHQISPTLVFNEQFEGIEYDEGPYDETLGTGCTINPNKETSEVTGAPADWGKNCLELIHVDDVNDNRIEQYNLGPYTKLYLRMEVICTDFSEVLGTSGYYHQITQGVSDAATVAYRLYFKNDSGNIKFVIKIFRDGSTGTEYTGFDTLSVNTRYRVEIRWDSSATGDEWEWKVDGVYQPNDIDSSDPVESPGTLTTGHAADIDHVNIGCGSSDSGVGDSITIYFDNYAWSEQDWIGPNVTLHSDGAHHYEPDSTPDLKYTLDRTRIRPAMVIHDWPFQYGTVASPTDLLIEYLKMNDNAASSTIAAAVGNAGNWENTSGSNRNTDNDDISTNIKRGTGLDTAGAYHIDHNVTVYDNAYFKQGSKIIHFTPQFAYNVATDQTIWSLYVDAGDYIKITYDATNDRYELAVSWSATLTTLNSTAFTENYSLQKLTTIHAGWDSEKDFLFLAIDGQVVDAGVNAGTPSASGATYVMTGADCENDATGTLEADIYIDENKALDECILPFGAFFIGNGQGLLADIDNPHADLTWFFDGQAAAAKGGTNLATTKNPTNSGGSFVTTDPLIGTYHWDSNGATNVLTRAEVGEDIVDYNNGFVAGWFNVQSAAGGEYLIDVSSDNGGTDYDRISAVLDASNNIDVTYKSQNTSETITGDIAITDGAWFFLLITWDDNGGDKKVHSYINGIENGTPQTIANTWGGGTGLTWYFTEDHNGTNGVDAFIQTLWMGKKANVPEIWTAFGKPLHTAETKKNTSVQQYGGTNSYQVVWLPNGSQLITTDDELVGA